MKIKNIVLTLFVLAFFIVGKDLNKNIIGFYTNGAAVFILIGSGPAGTTEIYPAQLARIINPPRSVAMALLSLANSNSFKMSFHFISVQKASSGPLRNAGLIEYGKTPCKSSHLPIIDLTKKILICAAPPYQEASANETVLFKSNTEFTSQISGPIWQIDVGCKLTDKLNCKYSNPVPSRIETSVARELNRFELCLGDGKENAAAFERLVKPLINNIDGIKFDFLIQCLRKFPETQEQAFFLESIRDGHLKVSATFR